MSVIDARDYAYANKRKIPLISGDIERDSFCGLFFGKGRVHTEYVNGTRYVFARKNQIIFCATGKYGKEILVKAPQKILNLFLPKDQQIIEEEVEEEEYISEENPVVKDFLKNLFK